MDGRLSLGTAWGAGERAAERLAWLIEDYLGWSVERTGTDTLVLDAAVVDRLTAELPNAVDLRSVLERSDR